MDLVGGASFGSVVGAFNAAERRLGLEKFMRNGRTLNLRTNLAFITHVPAGVLRREGARFVVSSNVVPPPESPPHAPLRSPSGTGSSWRI